MNIGVFDSGCGGLSILKALQQHFPYFNYYYLGDNARAPYGNREVDEIVDFSSQCIGSLFSAGCDMVVIACNTASIQFNKIQEQLDIQFNSRPIVEIVTPTAARIGHYGKAGIGVLGTAVTIHSRVYEMKINSFFPDRIVIGEACPIWVPIVEANEHLSKEAIGFLQRHVDNILLNYDVDTLLLGCTHYGLIAKRLKMLYPAITIIDQGEIIVSELTRTYLKLPIFDDAPKGQTTFVTSGSVEQFNKIASKFMGIRVKSSKIALKELFFLR